MNTLAMKCAGFVSLILFAGVSAPVHAGDVKLLKQPQAFPLVIGASGSYRLKSNIIVPDANTTAISITADDVTLDLNGYAIMGPTACSGFPISCTPAGTGDGIVSSADGVTVRNGTVRGMGGRGIELTGFGAVVDRMQLRSNGTQAIVTSNDGCRVTDNIVLQNGNSGMSLGGTCIVHGNVVRENGGNGIEVEGLSIVTGNVVVQNEAGLIDPSEAVVMGNIIVQNRSGGGITGGGTGIVTDNTVSANLGNGIHWSEGVVSNNTVVENAGDGISSGGGLVTGNAVESNDGAGIDAYSSGGYSNNVSNGNNGGDANPQANGFEIDANVCGGDMTCP